MRWTRGTLSHSPLRRIRSISTQLAHSTHHHVPCIAQTLGDGVGVEESGVAVGLAGRALQRTRGSGIIAMAARNTAFCLGGGSFVGIVRACWTKCGSRSRLEAKCTCRAKGWRKRAGGAIKSSRTGRLNAIPAIASNRTAVALPAAEERQWVHHLVRTVPAHAGAIIDGGVIRTDAL